MNFDFKNMETYHYFIGGGAIVAVLALVLYFVAGGKLKLPAIVAASLASLAVGVGAGVVLLGALGYNWNEKPKQEDATPPGDQAEGPPGGMTGGPQPKRKEQPKQDPGTVAKAQLVQLVGKLNQLVEKPPTVTLTDEKKQKIAAQIEDLGGLDAVSGDEAIKRVEALHEAVKDDKPSLEAVGYRFAPGKGGGGGGFGRPKELPPNPFKDAGNKEALESLLKRVETK